MVILSLYRRKRRLTNPENRAFGDGVNFFLKKIKKRLAFVGELLYTKRVLVRRKLTDTTYSAIAKR